MKDYRFAKFININGKFKPFEDERDIIDLQNKEIERLENIRIKTIEYIKDNLYYCVDNDDTNLLNILEGDVINETNNNN